MTIFTFLILLFWFIIFVYWFVSSFGVKKNHGGYMHTLLIRILIIASVVFLSRSQLFDQLQTNSNTSFVDPGWKVIGVIICGLGIAFAIWARRSLGANWGMPMSVKENPDLITTGPYRYVRHPIYTGVLCAMAGSAIVGGLVWLVPLVIFCGYFYYSATTEEKLMLQQFPKQYSLYMKHAKMLIPFLW